MPSDAFAALFGRYLERFGVEPLTVIGVDDATLQAMMERALERGRALDEDDYDSGLPEGADR